MRRVPLLLLAALGCDGARDSEERRERIPLPRRTDRVGDRYEVELRSRSASAADGATAEMRYTDEVLAVEDGRALRVRRTFRGDAGAEAAATEIDVRAGRGAGDGRRTDHFRQFERLMAGSCIGVEYRMDGALGAPPSSVLGVSDALWLNSRCASTLVRVAVVDGRRVAEFAVWIAFEGGTGPPRLDGTMRFDVREGILREVVLRGSADGRTYELHGIQTVVPLAEPR